MVVGNVECAVTVGKGHARHVPEDEHETKLLIVHVPSGDDQVLALGARSGVQVVREQKEDGLH